MEDALRGYELRLLRCTFLHTPLSLHPIEPSDSSQENSFSPFHAFISEMLVYIERGDYIGALSSQATRLVLDLPDFDLSGESPDRVYSELLHKVHLFISDSVDDSEKGCRVIIVMCIAVAAFFYFTQLNLTGPLEGLLKRPLPMKAWWEGWDVAPYVEAIDSQKSSYFALRCFCDILRIRWESTRSRTKDRALQMMHDLVERMQQASLGVSDRLPLCYATQILTIPALRKEYGELLHRCGLIGEATRIYEELRVMG